MKKILNISLIFFVILFQLKSFAEEKNYHKELITDWSRIFPDKNRNAAGPKFFKYIIDKKITYKDFIEFNKLYCAVSGSLIPPDSQPDEIFLTNLENDEKICGQYYKCCWPCLCDVMKYSETKKINIDFKDQSKDIYAIVIDNPCNKNDFPELVNRNYFCEGSELNQEYTYSIDNKLVMLKKNTIVYKFSGDLKFLQLQNLNDKSIMIFSRN